MDAIGHYDAVTFHGRMLYMVNAVACRFIYCNAGTFGIY